MFKFLQGGNTGKYRKNGKTKEKSRASMVGEWTGKYRNENGTGRDGKKFSPGAHLWYELLVVWEAQQNTCKELFATLQTGRVPVRLRNFITHHNLQIVKVDKLDHASQFTFEWSSKHPEDTSCKNHSSFTDEKVTWNNFKARENCGFQVVTSTQNSKAFELYSRS